MEIICIDVDIPRIDQRQEPLNITEGNLYEVIVDDGHFFRIINDLGKSARYMKIRFEVVKEFTLADVEEIAKAAYLEGCNDREAQPADDPAVMWGSSDTKTQVLCRNVDNFQFKKDP